MCTSGGSAEHGISAVVAVFLTKMEPGHHLPRLRLRGLEEDENYVIEEIFPNRAKRNPSTGQIELTGGAPQWQLGNQKVRMSGATLMSIGLPIRLSFDGDCCAFVLTRARGVSGSRQV